MKLSILLFSLFCWVATPGLSYAGDGHKHGKGEQHSKSEKDDDHSGHAHGKSKKKAKKKHGEKGHDHSEEEDHSEEDGHNHDKSSSTESGDAHGEDHEHAGSEKGSHGNEEEHAHSDEGEHEDGGDHAHADEGEHGEKDQHAHAEEGGHDDHGEEGGHDEHGASGIGPGKAIIEVANEGNRFKLSKESEEFLKIKTMKIVALGGGQYRVPKSIIVTYQNSKGIYVKTDGWFEIKNIKVLSTENGHSVVSVESIGTNTLVASTGLGFLRAAHLQASGQGGKGHAH